MPVSLTAAKIALSPRRPASLGDLSEATASSEWAQIAGERRVGQTARQGLFQLRVQMLGPHRIPDALEGQGLAGRGRGVYGDDHQGVGGNEMHRVFARPMEVVAIAVHAARRHRRQDQQGSQFAAAMLSAWIGFARMRFLQVTHDCICFLYFNSAQFRAS